jgi:hypothetical protein
MYKYIAHWVAGTGYRVVINRTAARRRGTTSRGHSWGSEVAKEVAYVVVLAWAEGIEKCLEHGGR